MAKVTTIDVNAREWFDRVNGNSYFSAVVTVNYSLPGEKTYKIPFQYGYDDHYKEAAAQKLEDEKVIKRERNGGVIQEPLWKYCQRNGIILRCNINRNCMKRELL